MQVFVDFRQFYLEVYSNLTVDNFAKLILFIFIRVLYLPEASLSVLTWFKSILVANLTFVKIY